MQEDAAAARRRHRHRDWPGIIAVDSKPVVVVGGTVWMGLSSGVAGVWNSSCQLAYVADERVTLAIADVGPMCCVECSN